MYRVPEGVVCLSPSWGFQRRQKCRDSRAMPPELWQHWSPLPRGLWSSGFLFSPWDSGWWFPCNAVVYRLYTLFMCLVLDTVALVYLQQGLLWAALFFRGAGAATSSHDSSLNRDQGPGRRGLGVPLRSQGSGSQRGVWEVTFWHIQPDVSEQQQGYWVCEHLHLASWASHPNLTDTHLVVVGPKRIGPSWRCWCHWLCGRETSEGRYFIFANNSNWCHCKNWWKSMWCWPHYIKVSSWLPILHF